MGRRQERDGGDPRGAARGDRACLQAPRGDRRDDGRARFAQRPFGAGRRLGDAAREGQRGLGAARRGVAGDRRRVRLGPGRGRCPGRPARRAPRGRRRRPRGPPWTSGQQRRVDREGGDVRPAGGGPGAGRGAHLRGVGRPRRGPRRELPRLAARARGGGRGAGRGARHVAPARRGAVGAPDGAEVHDPGDAARGSGARGLGPEAGGGGGGDGDR